MVKHWLAGLTLICLGALLPACASDIGETCATKGATDECVDGAVCEMPGTDTTEPQCLKICKDASECASTENCNGVSGSSLKACTPKTK